MSQDPSQNRSHLPGYVASATPNTLGNRVGWLMSTAATYAGIMLWFVFWQTVPSGGGETPGGVLGHGLPVALGALIIAAFVCHYFFYFVPAQLGMKTGLPLYIVGTSTYGVYGGFLMPGFLMGLLQFGWLSVNGYFSGLLLSKMILPYLNQVHVDRGPAHIYIGIGWAIVAAFIGLKGINYVGKVASFMPIIPIVILIYLLIKVAPGINAFNEAKVLAEGAKPVELYGNAQLGVIALMCTYIVGFFATAGAAGCDFGSNNRSSLAVQMGGLVGIVFATIFTGGIALLIIAGAQSMPGVDPTVLNPIDLMNVIVGEKVANIFMLLLAIAAFPSACFSSFIAANSFKTTLPKIHPFITCGLGTAIACYLIYTGAAGKADKVFTVIGASFGPVCGAMMADYILAGFRWSGPRAGFNPAGWLSWIVGFVVGAIGLVYGPLYGWLTTSAPDVIKTLNLPAAMPFDIPCPPVSAFLVGFLLYFIFSIIGLRSRVLEMPQRIDM